MDDLVKRLRAKKKAAGFKTGLSEDGGHRVAEMQYVPDPDAQEAADRIEADAAHIRELEAQLRNAEQNRDMAVRAVHAQTEHVRNLEAVVEEARETMAELLGYIEGEGMPGDYSPERALLARMGGEHARS